MDIFIGLCSKRLLIAIKTGNVAGRSFCEAATRLSIIVVETVIWNLIYIVRSRFGILVVFRAGTFCT